jgi:hypothetical protein
MIEIMSRESRGVFYIVWGDQADEYLDRSIASLRLHHPDLPVHVERISPRDPQRSLREKATMARLTPFETTLYLDVDTTVMGNLDYAFEQAQRFGIACRICESPWLRRYDHTLGDQLEYNTGVLCFNQSARRVFDAWDRLADTTPASCQWTKLDNILLGSPYDDQASFAAALIECSFNPFALPINYNFRPEYDRTVFLPLKIWHDYIPPPQRLIDLSLACERGDRAVTLVNLMLQNPSQPPPHQAKKLT